MSRIRSVHPGIWTDEGFMALTAYARLLVIGIWIEAFDDGVFEWKPLTLKAKVFPVDHVDVVPLLDELVTTRFIRREEVAGRPIGLIRNFRRWQRPKKPNSSKMLRAEWGTYVGLDAADGEPLPDWSTTDGEPVPNQFSSREENSPQMEDVGGRMKGEDKTSAPVPAAEAQAGARVSFEDVVEAYPRDPGAQGRKARVAFEKTVIDERAEILAAALRVSRAHAQDCRERGRSVEEGAKYVTQLHNWLDSGQWRDAAKLPVKGEIDPTLVIIKRGTDDCAALERLRGKPIPQYSDNPNITVTKAELEQARGGIAHAA